MRAGDDGETIDLLLRLARQAVRRAWPPPPDGHHAWSDDAYRELISDAYVRKGHFIEKALLATVTDKDLELYLLSTFENVLRDQARETERGKLIERLKTILGHEPQFLRHTSPYNAWRLDTAPDTAWQGDIGTLIRAAAPLRGLAITTWTTAGPTPKATRDAIVNVCETALDEAAGYVRDPDIATVVQNCIPVAPKDRRDVEHLTPADDLTPFEDLTTPDALVDHDEPDVEAVASAVWNSLTYDERRAVPHLKSAGAVAFELRLPRRAATAITQSARAKIRSGTTDGIQSAVLRDLLDRSRTLDVERGGDTP